MRLCAALGHSQEGPCGIVWVFIPPKEFKSRILQNCGCPAGLVLGAVWDVLECVIRRCTLSDALRVLKKQRGCKERTHTYKSVHSRRGLARLALGTRRNPKSDTQTLYLTPILFCCNKVGLRGRRNYRGWAVSVRYKHYQFGRGNLYRVTRALQWSRYRQFD